MKTITKLITGALIFLHALGVLGQSKIIKEVDVDMEGNKTPERVTVTLTKKEDIGRNIYNISIKENGISKYPSLSSWTFKELEIGDFNEDGLYDVKYFITDSTGRIFSYDKVNKQFISIGF